MKNILILLTSILFLSCNQENKSNKKESLEAETEIQNNENFDWLIGNWERLNEKEGKENFENWKKISSTEYSGYAFTLQNNDTISQETMNIIETDGKWRLLVKTPDEKDATEFIVTIPNKNEFVCVNDSIDFPKKIKYWIEGNKLKALLSNNEMEIPFEFEKIK